MALNPNAVEFVMSASQDKRRTMDHNNNAPTPVPASIPMRSSILASGNASSGKRVWWSKDTLSSRNFSAYGKDLRQGERRASIPLTTREAELMKQMESALDECRYLWGETDDALAQTLVSWRCGQRNPDQLGRFWEQGLWPSLFSLPIIPEIRSHFPEEASATNLALARSTCLRKYKVCDSEAAPQPSCICLVNWGILADENGAKRRQKEKLEEDQRNRRENSRRSKVKLAAETRLQPWSTASDAALQNGPSLKFAASYKQCIF